MPRHFDNKSVGDEATTLKFKKVISDYLYELAEIVHVKGQMYVEVLLMSAQGPIGFQYRQLYIVRYFHV